MSLPAGRVHARTQRVHDIVRQCVDVERRFIEGALPKGLQGLNAKSIPHVLG